MASRTVRAESSRVVSAAKFRLVLGVARQATKFDDAVGKLTLVAILAIAVLLERPAQFRLVAIGSSGHLLGAGRAVLFLPAGSLLQGGAIGKGSWAHVVRREGSTKMAG